MQCDLGFSYCSMPHHWTLLIEWQRARMMKVTPDPSAFKTKVNCDQESHLRSPLSAVSDSFGHENEVDISKSSEEKTSATGSNVAPRRMGSLFSPMEKNNNKKRGSPLLHRGWELSTRSERKKKGLLCRSLGSKKSCGLDLTGWEGLVT